jgi:hypothetical protein
MHFVIKERKFSWTSEYDVAINGTNYNARAASFTFLDNIEIRSDKGDTVARVKQLFSPFVSKYDFFLSGGRVFQFRCEKAWTGVYVCQCADEIYRLYEHKGLRFSIFKDEQQVAAFKKNRITIGQGHQYEVDMNSNLDPVLVLCIVLAEGSDDDEQSRGETVSIDLGNIGPEARPFDEMWRAS